MKFLIVFAILILLLQLLKSLSIKIEISNLKINLPKIGKTVINKDSKIFLKLYILNKIKIGQIDLKKINKNNKKIKNKIQKNIQKDKFNLNTINFLKNSNYILEKMDLKILIGFDDAALTAISVGAISGIISYLLREKITDTKVQKFNIMPVYENVNIFKLEFDGIFTFKMENIIGIVKYLKRRVEKDGRTSNRRTYAYSNE